jgi:putative redox protein
MSRTVHASLSWQSGTCFLARSQSGHAVTLDSVSHADHIGPSPMELLLIGVAGCTAMDVVAILRKMHEELTGLEVSIAGERAETNPKRYTAVKITYRLKGRTLAMDKAEHAVALSLSTYCGAIASLRPDCKVTSSIEISAD